MLHPQLTFGIGKILYLPLKSCIYLSDLLGIPAETPDLLRTQHPQWKHLIETH